MGAGGGSFVNSCGSFVVPFLVLYMVHRGYGTGLAAWAVAAYAAGKMTAGPVGGIATSSLIIGTGFGLLVLAHTAVLLAVAVTVWSLGELAQWPVAAAYTTRLAPRGMTGRYAGARSLCYGTALLIAPLAGTALYRLSPGLLWSACAVAGLCAAAVITPHAAVLQPPPFTTSTWHTDKEQT